MAVDYTWGTCRTRPSRRMWRDCSRRPSFPCMFIIFSWFWLCSAPAVRILTGYYSERIDMVIDPFTGRNPSYCFVDVGSKAHAARAMAELDGRELLGRTLRIKPGVQKSAAGSSSTSISTGTSVTSTSTPSSGMSGMDRWRPSSAKTGDQAGPAKTDPSRRVYVGGLPRLTDQEAVQSNMATFFQGYEM